MSKTWKYNNLLGKMKEAEDEFNYLEDLKKLINGEAVAAIQYKIASKVIMGSENQDYLVNHFTEHSDEEWSHYDQLVDALMEREVQAGLEIKDLLVNATPTTEELADVDCEYLRDFFERAEENAINAYTVFYDKIVDADPELADIINGIITDERDHKLDFTRIR